MLLLSQQNFDGVLAEVLGPGDDSSERSILLEVIMFRVFERLRQFGKALAMLLDEANIQGSHLDSLHFERQLAVILKIKLNVNVGSS